MKRIKLSESQIEMIQNATKPKKIKLSEEQFDRIFDTEDSRTSFLEALAKYTPQTEDENIKTTKSFNEGVGMLSFGDFIEKLKPVIKDLMKGDYTSTVALANELGVTKDDIITEFISLGIAEFSKRDLDYVRFRRDELKTNIKALYNQLIGAKAESELTEDAPMQSAGLTCTFMNDDMAILKDGSASYYFNYGDLDKSLFNDYADSEILDTTIGDKGDSTEIFNTYDDVVITEDIISEFVNSNFNKLSNGFGVQGLDDGKDIIKIDKELADTLLGMYPNDAAEITTALISMSETTTSGSSGAFVAPISLEESEVPKMTMFSDESGIECKKMTEEEVDEATTTASSGSFVTPSMWAKSKADHIPSKKPIYVGGQIVQESKETAKLFVALKNNHFEPSMDFVMVNNNVWAKDIDVARRMADDMIELYGVTIDDENINKDGNVPVTFGSPEGVQGELQFEGAINENVSVESYIDSFKEVDTLIQNAKASGNNVCPIKAGGQEFFIHLDGVTIGDGLIETIEYISGSKDEIRNKMNHGKSITDKNIKLAKPTLNRLNIMLNNTKHGEVTDLDNLSESINGKFVRFDDCTKLNNNTDAQDGKCSQGAVDNVVKTFESICRDVSSESGKSIDEVKSVLLKNKMYESDGKYGDYMWIEMGKGNREAEEIRSYLEDSPINGDTYTYMAS